MNIKEYFKEKILFLSINLILFILLCMFLLYIDVHIIWSVGIFIIWFLPMSIYFTLDYIRRKEFYNNIIYNLDVLDKGFLVSKIIHKPEFLEGKIFYEALKSIEQSLYKEIKNHEIKEINYREYVETWIHEIKTPVLASKLIINNNKNEVTNNINDEILKIESYLEQILYYARSNDASKDYIIKEVNLENIIIKSVKKNAKSFIYKNISLELDNLDEIVYTDTKWIDFIINQIIINSIKYCDKDNAKIKIYSTKSTNKVILTIEDNGVGISTQDINRVFDKGFTGENGRKYGKSTGMGLYICKNLANKLGLGLKLTSIKEEGTKVDIIFPKGSLTNL